jgi:hypothetical protein
VAYSALKIYEKYEQQKLLVNTDLDPSRALSSEEPSLRGFAMNLVAAGLEGFALFRLWRKGVELRKLAIKGKSKSLTEATDEFRALMNEERQSANLTNRLINELKKGTPADEAAKAAGKPPPPKPPKPPVTPPKTPPAGQKPPPAGEKPSPAGEKPPTTRAEKPPASKGSVAKPPATQLSAEEFEKLAMSAEQVRKLAADRIKLGLVVNPKEIEIVDRRTFVQALRNAGWDGKGPLPAGFVDPKRIETGLKMGQPSGRIWILRGADDPQTIFHEAIHSYSIKASARGPFLQRFGSFLEEGITESLTRKHFGAPAGAHGYDRHVAFVKRLSSRLGISEERLTRAYLDGDIEGLTRAIQQGLGGDGALTGAFLGALRNVGTNADNHQALRDAVRIMMTRRMPPAP